MKGLFARAARRRLPSSVVEAVRPAPRIEREYSDVGCTFGIHSVVVDGWHGVLGASAKEYRIVLLVTEPEGFRICRAFEYRSPSGSYPSGDDLSGWLRDECRRLVRAYVVGGDAPDVVPPRGTTAVENRLLSDLERMVRGEFFFGACTEQRLHASARRVRGLDLSVVLGDWIPGNGSTRFLRRPNGGWEVHGHGSGFVNRSVYEATTDDWTSAGSVAVGRAFACRPARDAVHAAVRRRPWLAGLPEAELEILAADCGPGASPRDVASAWNSRTRVDEPWSAAAVACMDRHVGSAPWRGPKDEDRHTGDDVHLMHAGTGRRPVDADPGRWCPEAFLSLLSALPASWLPKDRESFEALVRVSVAMFSSFPWEDMASVARLLSRSRGDWSAIDRTVSSGSGRKLADAADMVRFVASGIAMPSLRATGRTHVRLHEMAARVASRLASGEGGVQALLSASEEWHSRQGFLPVLAAVAKTWWDAPAQGLASEKGPSLVFLRSTEDLLKEGREMEHCVGSYASSCAAGSTHVASIRRIDKETHYPSESHVSLSTVEIRFVAGKPVVRQHRGFGNGDPPSEAVEVLARWTKGVEDGSIRVNDGLDARLRRAPTDADFLVPDVGMPADWRGILRGRAVSGSWTELAEEVAAVFDLVAGGNRFAPDEGIDA